MGQTEGETQVRVQPQAADAGPLDQAELRLLRQAGQRARAVRGAVRLARINGWSFVVFGGAALLSALLEPGLLLLGAALVVLGVVELRGAAMLRAYRAQGARLLAWNQAGVFACIAVYCAYRVYAMLSGPSPFDELLQEPLLRDLLSADGGSLQELLDSLGHAYRMLGLAVYGTLAGATALYQGLCALYYASRRAAVAAYAQHTPRWIREIQEALSC